MLIQPYLYFNGRCEEALEFYRTALGAEIQMKMRFDESPDPTPPGMLAPGFEKKIMHSSFRIGETTLMASDGCGTVDMKFDGMALSLTVKSDDEAKRVFAALQDGGQVQMPLTPTFFSSRFGMVADRFGVTWLIVVEK
jgi:PhnB protein